MTAFSKTALTFWLGAFLLGSAANADPLPEVVVTYCLDCHDADTEKGDINLDLASIDWANPDAVHLWEKVHHAVHHGEMPPAKKKQPSNEERATLLAWLETRLSTHSKPGGTVLRRLNKEEYENSISALLGTRFQVPGGFPTDTEHRGFDNQGDGLILSPPLMAQYFELATAAADLVLPPPPPKDERTSEKITVNPDGFALNFTTGHEIDGVLRMAQRDDPIGRGSVFPKRFTARKTGRYQVEIDLSSYRPTERHVPRVQLFAYPVDLGIYAKVSTLRKAAEFVVDGKPDQPRTFRAEIDLQAGESIVVHYDNAAIIGSNRAELSANLQRAMILDPALGAAWVKAGYQRSDRGWDWLKRVEAIRDAPGFDPAGFDPKGKTAVDFANRVSRYGANLSETLACLHFTTGPALNVHEMRIDGPLPNEAETTKFSPADLSEGFAGSKVHPLDDGSSSLRVVSTSPSLGKGGTWIKRFIASDTGRYQFKISLAPHGRDAHEAPVLQVIALPPDFGGLVAVSSGRIVAEITIPLGSKPTDYPLDLDLQKGEGLGFRYGNSIFGWKDPNDPASNAALDRFIADKKFYAAWLEAGFVRGRTPWEEWALVKAALERGPKAPPAGALEVEAADLHPLGRRHLSYVIEAMHHDLGPAIDIRGGEVVGPVLPGAKRQSLTLQAATSVGAPLAADPETFRIASSWSTPEHGTASVERPNIEQTGTYEVSFRAAAFQEKEGAYKRKSGRFQIELFKSSATDPQTPERVGEFLVDPKKPSQRFATEVQLTPGETLSIRWPNGPLLAGKKNKSIGPSKEAVAELMKNGPALDINQLVLNGPVRLVEDAVQVEQRRLTQRFLGDRGDMQDPEFAADILGRALEQVFRRPVDEPTLQRYTRIALTHQNAGHRFEDGIHLALRTALCSPRFLYRGQADGKMDSHDLASRLSFFLTNGPPDKELRAAAFDGTIEQPDVLKEHALRLLSSPQSRKFLDSFLGQWLDLRVLDEIMPDPRLLNFNSKHLVAIKAEPRLFVEEILRKNLPMDTFIDPDFTYLNRRISPFYDLKAPAKNDLMKRVKLEKGGRNGGILGMSAVMMATANGVDTQPVLRGAWLLENIFGTPTPEPPDDIPAVEPDTTGAKTIRELLERHRADESCAGCHARIDPVGFALENFDPVGRWREHYPKYVGEGDDVRTEKGLPIDSTGIMPDGTRLDDVTDLKRYLVENIDLFSTCVAEKLLVYGTGREPSFGDKKEIQRVVGEVKESGNGFRDLIVELILSESFRTK